MRMVEGRFCITGLFGRTGLRLLLLRCRDGGESGTGSRWDVVVVVVVVVGPSAVTVVYTLGKGSVPDAAPCLELFMII